MALSQEVRMILILLFFIAIMSIFAAFALYYETMVTLLNSTLERAINHTYDLIELYKTLFGELLEAIPRG